MKYPIYPEYYRKLARGTRKVSNVLGVLCIICTLILVAAFVLSSETMFLVGFVSSFTFICLFMGTKGAKEVYKWVEIDEKGLRVIDEKGDVLRNAEYRYVRNMEVRTLRLSLEPRDSGGHEPCSGLEAKLIMVYIDGAYCFEDLKLVELREFGRKKNVFYWCDQVLFHHNCVAFSYDEEAWKLLRGYAGRGGV